MSLCIVYVVVYQKGFEPAAAGKTCLSDGKEPLSNEDECKEAIKIHGNGKIFSKTFPTKKNVSDGCICDTCTIGHCYCYWTNLPITPIQFEICKSKGEYIHRDYI